MGTKAKWCPQFLYLCLPTLEGSLGSLSGTDLGEHPPSPHKSQGKQSAPDPAFCRKTKKQANPQPPAGGHRGEISASLPENVPMAMRTCAGSHPSLSPTWRNNPKWGEGGERGKQRVPRCLSHISYMQCKKLGQTRDKMQIISILWWFTIHCVHISVMWLIT